MGFVGAGLAENLDATVLIDQNPPPLSSAVHQGAGLPNLMLLPMNFVWNPPLRQ
ncbi:MAG: hypothetical protein AB4080_10965 [Trichodesmium sp.]